MPAARALAVGVILRPSWATNNLWPLDAKMKGATSYGRGKKGLRDAIVLILPTGFCFGAVVAFLLNAIIPIDRAEPDETVHLHHYADADEDAKALKA
jgi:xanthine/uracil permease